MNWYKMATKFQVDLNKLKNIASMSQNEFVANTPEGYKWNPTKSGEADRNTPNITTIGPSFFGLDYETKLHILVHELAHDIAEKMFVDGTAWDLLDAKLLHNSLYQGEKIIPGKTFHFYGANKNLKKLLLMLLLM
jgi:hypothetical protein